MDAHSNPRKALKLAQEQEDRRRRRNERDSARRAAETAEQRSERLRKQRERYRARRVAQTASERQATSQQRSPRKHERLMAASWNLVLCPAYFFAVDETSWIPERELRFNRVLCREHSICCHNSHCFNSVPFKVKMSCKHGYIGHDNMLNLFRKISCLSFTQSLMNVCILENCNLMCTYTVVTDPCHIPPLTQSRPMMLCIYTSISTKALASG